MDAFVEERLSDYLDGTLSESERAMVEAHLAESERARTSLESLRYTVDLLKQTPAPALPRQFTLPVTSRAPARAASGWLIWGLRGVAVGATAAFVILLTTILVRQPNLLDTANAPAQQQPPVAVIALAPTETSVATSAPVPASDAGATGPTMITVEAPTEAAEAYAVTETAAPASQAPVLPTNSSVQQKAPPPAQPQKTTVNKSAVAVPTMTPAAPEVNAAGSSPAETPSSAMASADDTTRRTTGVRPMDGVVIVDQLRVRRGPGLTYRSIGVLKLGDKVGVLGRSADSTWLAIEYPINSETGLGWIGVYFVSLSEPMEMLPQIEAPPALKPQKAATPVETP